MHGNMALNEKDKIYDRLASDLPINTKWAPAVVDCPVDRLAKLRVLRSVRDDPLAELHARNQIDDAMLAAGRQWQRHHELSEIGGIKAIDPGKEAVDGGKFPEPITDKQMDAFRELQRADWELGKDGRLLVRCILGDRKTIAQAAILCGKGDQLGIKFTSRRFKECLESLAVLWGYAQKS